MEHSSSTSTGVSEADDSTSRNQQSNQRAEKKRRWRRSKDGSSTDQPNGHSKSAKRKSSLGKAARDPRDEPEGKKSKKHKTSALVVKAPAAESGAVTRSPSPLIDFDGLSRPSESFLAPSCSSVNWRR